MPPNAISIPWTDLCRQDKVKTIWSHLLCCPNKRKTWIYTASLLQELSMLAHLVSQFVFVSSLGKSTKGVMLVLGRTRAGETVCRLIPAHHKGAPMSSLVTHFLQETPIAYFSGPHCAVGTRRSPPTSNPSLPRLTMERNKQRQNCKIELGYSVIRARLQGWIRYACGESGMGTKGRDSLKGLKSKVCRGT